MNEATESGKRAASYLLQSHSRFRQNIVPSHLLKRVLQRLPQTMECVAAAAVGIGSVCTSSASCEQLAFLLELTRQSATIPESAVIVIEPVLQTLDCALLSNLFIRHTQAPLHDAAFAEQNNLLHLPSSDDTNAYALICAFHCDGSVHAEVLSLVSLLAPNVVLIANAALVREVQRKLRDTHINSQMTVNEEELLEPAHASVGAFNDLSVYTFTSAPVGEE